MGPPKIGLFRTKIIPRERVNLEGAENVILHQKSCIYRMNQHGVEGWHNIEQNMRRKSLEILTPILLIMIDNC